MTYTYVIYIYDIYIYMIYICDIHIYILYHINIYINGIYSCFNVLSIYIRTNALSEMKLCRSKAVAPKAKAKARVWNGGVQNWGYPITGWVFLGEHPMKMDENWGLSSFFDDMGVENDGS